MAKCSLYDIRGWRTEGQTHLVMRPAPVKHVTTQQTKTFISACQFVTNVTQVHTTLERRIEHWGHVCVLWRTWGRSRCRLMGACDPKSMLRMTAEPQFAAMSTTVCTQHQYMLQSMLQSMRPSTVHAALTRSLSLEPDGSAWLSSKSLTSLVLP